MTFRRSIRTGLPVVLLALAQLGFAAGARAADIPTHAIAANVNDAGIDPARRENLVWLAPEARRVGKLLVFLPYGAQNNFPTEFEEIGAEGGRLGYHSIVLAYKNEVPIAAPAGCGMSVDPPVSPPDCAINARMEILDGGGESTVVNVDRANSIENRLIKLLEHLKLTYPDEGWSQFLDAGGEPNWSETVIAGGSLGAGQAALIGQLHEVKRVSLFAGWTDAKHGWVAPGMTPVGRYFALIHARDNFFARMCDAYEALGVAPACPLPNFTTPPANALLVENRPPPLGTPLLVFNLDHAPGQPVVGDLLHASTVRDGYVAKEEDGTVSQQVLGAWRSVLGDSDADTYLDDADNCAQLANADQADTDNDAKGNACDPTPQGTTPPSITVPGHITVDATGPAGATVGYTVSATDDIDPDPTLSCTPSAGSRFAIGDTPVACTAGDRAGNTASASFVVTVRGASQQLANLIGRVINASSLPAAVKTQLIATLQSLAAGLDPNRPLQRKLACLTLKVFTNLAHYLAPPARAAEWTADANRISSVLAC